jgi:hypothetical protein
MEPADFAAFEQQPASTEVEVAPATDRRVVGRSGENPQGQMSFLEQSRRLMVGS